jgi:REP element-mobilizing transposase RayT
MKSPITLKTWSKSRGNRLPGSCYPAGYPVHVILGSHERQPVFRNPNLAGPLFSLVADHSKTQACCLMPDHLHWLISDASSMKQLVHSFKSYSTYAARTLGHHSKVWQRSYWDHVVRRDEDLREIVEYIVHNPVRRGMVDNFRQYPYQIIKI